MCILAKSKAVLYKHIDHVLSIDLCYERVSATLIMLVQRFDTSSYVDT